MYGLWGQMLDWIQNFFIRKKAKSCFINGCESSWKYVMSGVAQGSILGLLLFWCTLTIFLLVLLATWTSLQMIVCFNVKSCQFKTVILQGRKIQLSTSMFLGVIHFNPFFVIITLVYGSSRHGAIMLIPVVQKLNEYWA